MVQGVGPEFNAPPQKKKEKGRKGRNTKQPENN
jgi:hypothetical protein